MKRHLFFVLLLATAGAAFGANRRNLGRPETPAKTEVGPGERAAARDTYRGIYMANGDVIMPYILNGPGEVTRIRLINMENREVTYQLFFVGDDGLPSPTDLKGAGNVSNITGRIAALGSATIETSGTIKNETIGWSFFDAGAARIAATVSTELFESAGTYGFSYPASNILEKLALVPFDNSDGSDTGVNILNLDTDPSTLTIVVRDPDGKEIYREEKKLPALGAAGFYPGDKIDPAKTPRGTVEISVDAKSRGGIGVNALQLYEKGGLNIFPGYSPLQ